MTIAIETFGLTRRFARLNAVQDLALQVPRGSIYGFLGPNGAGKTTTIRLLLGLIRPTAGEVSLFGQPFRAALLHRVGALVETPSLYPHLTGRENLEVTRRLLGAPKERITRALGIVGLAADANRLVRTYSLGMRQRLGLGLALINEPELLILDEPTNGLDPAGILEMRELIRRLPLEHGITVFLSSHLLNEVEQIATHIGIIQQGRLKFQGQLADLQQQRRESISIGVEDTAQALNVLQQAGWAAHPDEALQRLTVATHQPTQAAEINALLVSAGLRVFHLGLERPSLEETFLQLTNAEGVAQP